MVQIFKEPILIHSLMSGVRNLLDRLLVPFKRQFRGTSSKRRRARDSGEDEGTKERGDRGWAEHPPGAQTTSRKHSPSGQGISVLSLSVPLSLSLSLIVVKCIQRKSFPLNHV